MVSVADPAKPVPLAYGKVPAGDTTSCVDGRRYLWTGGPAKADSMPGYVCVADNNRGVDILWLDVH